MSTQCDALELFNALSDADRRFIISLMKELASSQGYADDSQEKE